MRTKYFSFILIVGILCSVSVQAQHSRQVVQNMPTFDQDKLHFGFTIGTNFLNFQTAHSGQYFTDDATGQDYRLYTDLNNLSPGFHVGLIASLRLGEYFNLRALPGISFGQRDMQFVKIIGAEGTHTDELIYEEDITVPIKSTFVQLPILFKYKAVRDGNARPYLIGGTTLSVDLARSKREDMVLKPFDASIDFGIGSDFYFSYFRFGLEAKVSIGMLDMLWHDRPLGDFDPRYIQSIDKLKSLIFSLSLNFE